MENKDNKIKEIIKNLEGTVKKMGDSLYVESISSAFQPTRAKKSILKAKIRDLKKKLNG
jgi:hypothetical protein